MPTSGSKEPDVGTFLYNRKRIKPCGGCEAGPRHLRGGAPCRPGSTTLRTEADVGLPRRPTLSTRQGHW